MRNSEPVARWTIGLALPEMSNQPVPASRMPWTAMSVSYGLTLASMKSVSEAKPIEPLTVTEARIAVEISSQTESPELTVTVSPLRGAAPFDQTVGDDHGPLATVESVVPSALEKARPLPASRKKNSLGNEK